jgi:hypothetical protein
LEDKGYGIQLFQLNLPKQVQCKSAKKSSVGSESESTHIHAQLFVFSPAHAALLGIAN